LTVPNAPSSRANELRVAGARDDRPRPRGSGELQAEHGHSAGPFEQHEIAGFDVPALEQADPRRDARARQRRGLLVRQVLGNRDEAIGVRDDDFGQHAARVAAACRRQRRGRRRAVEPVLEKDARDAIADFEARDAGPDGDDLAGAVGQRHAVRLRAAAPVAAAQHHEIAAVQRRGAHANGHLGRGGRRRLDLPERELERLALRRELPLADRLGKERARCEQRERRGGRRQAA
jgi:hypothetical protein